MVNSRRRDTALLLALAFLVRLGLALTVTRPGYMDAAYYAAGAERLAQGGRLSEPFIWNYLNDPVSITHPGFLYWMPLPSLLGAPSAALFPGSFLALQVPFVVLSALLAPVAYGLAWSATRSRLLAWAAGLLAVFSGFFFPYWTLPETFAPFALFGSLALRLAGTSASEDRGGSSEMIRWLSVGLLVGLAHLTRADGVLLLPLAALAPLVSSGAAGARRTDDDRRASGVLRCACNALTPGASHLAVVVVAYVLVMGPWFARNLAVFGAPLSPASLKTIWLTDYDDLFCYDCDLSLSSYLTWGWDSILLSKLSALWINFQRLLAEDCLVFLLPFAAIGFHRLRRDFSFLLALVYLAAIYLAHSLLFTFPGWRGGFFHASGAVLPFLYAAGMKGLDEVVRWLARHRRGWRPQQARTVFAAAAVVGGLLLSGGVSRQKIPAWLAAHKVYEEADQWLQDREATEARVMVGNPPAFWYHTHRAAIVIPNGGVKTLLDVADRYGIGYVLLEADHPEDLASLHAGRARHPRLRVVKTWSAEDSILYAVRR